MPKSDDLSPRQRLTAARQTVDALVKRRAVATLAKDLLSIDSMLDRARRALAVAEKDWKAEAGT